MCSPWFTQAITLCNSRRCSLDPPRLPSGCTTLAKFRYSWLLTTAKRALSNKPHCRLQSISSHKATSDVTDAMSMSLCIPVPLVLVVQRDTASNEQRHCSFGGRSVCVCVSLSLIIIAYSVSLTQHSAERAQSSAWVIPADPGSAFNPTLRCTEKGAVPCRSELRSAQSQHCLCSRWSHITHTHTLAHIQLYDYIAILIRTSLCGKSLFI